MAGSVSHKQKLTIIGSGFGTKTQATPVVWDDCSGTSITEKWSGGWPSASGPSYNIGYRTPAQVGRGVSLPHSHITKYLCGAHYPRNGADEGYNVMVWKNKTKPSFPAYSYWSYYERFDPLYPTSGSGNDNCKVYDYSCGTEPYAMISAYNNNWYIEYVGGVPSLSSKPQWHFNDDTEGFSGYCLYFLGPNYTDRAGHNSYWEYGNNPIAGWHKVEIEIKWTDQPDGYVKVWDNGVLMVNYVGETDHQWTGTARNEAIGGYARLSSTNAWRYFADIYYDQSRARVIIGNSSTLNSSTIREVQIPTAWSDTSIIVDINQGVFNAGQTAFLYVVNPNGEVNGTGYPVTFSTTQSDATPPAAPENISVQIIQ